MCLSHHRSTKWELIRGGGCLPRGHLLYSKGWMELKTATEWGKSLSSSWTQVHVLQHYQAVCILWGSMDPLQMSEKGLLGTSKQILATQGCFIGELHIWKNHDKTEHLCCCSSVQVISGASCSKSPQIDKNECMKMKLRGGTSKPSTPQCFQVRGPWKSFTPLSWSPG